MLIRRGGILISQMISEILRHILIFALHIEGNTFPKPLSAKKEKECFVKMKEGDKQAREELIRHNLRLVAHIVKKYYSSTNDHDDLISIGAIGLIKAVESYDCSKGIRFATYASRCIENEILMYFRSLKKSANDVYIGDAIDTDKDGNVLSFSDIIADDENLIEIVELKCKSDILYKHVQKVLNDREKKVIMLRYGLYGGCPLTQRETASHLNISRSYVSRIEKKALMLLNKAFKNDEKIEKNI